MLGGAAAAGNPESPGSFDQPQNVVPSTEFVSVELPGPAGWKKKFTPKKGGTPRRNEIVFIAPTGEEIKNKRQLDLYLKSHPDGPSASDFDWGTGEMPRRSARISERAKAVETPESEPLKKRGRKSGPKKGEKEQNESEEDVSATREKGEIGNVEMIDAEAGVERAKEDAAEQKEEGSYVAVKEAEDGVEDVAAVEEKKEGGNVAKKVEENGAEMMREAVSTGAGLDKKLAEQSEKQEKDEVARLGEDNHPEEVERKTKGEEQSQAEKVGYMEANKSQTEQEGEVQAEKEEIKPQEQHRNDKPDAVAATEEQKVEEDQEHKLEHRSVKSTDIIPENGSHKD